MKKVNRIFGWILAVVMLTGMLPANAVSLIYARHTGSATYVNPLYPDASAPECPKAPAAGVLTTEKVASYATIDDAAAVVRGAMENRLTTVQFSYTQCENEAAIKPMFDEILDTALEHTGVPTQGDYLQWQYGGYSATWSYNKNHDGSVSDIRYTS